MSDSRTDSGGKDELIAKPFTRAELLVHVRRVLDAPYSDGGAAKTRG